MKKIIILASSCALLLMSCNSDTTTSETTTTVANTSFKDEHNSKNSLDWHGQYESVIPCADCPGIKVNITLHDDNRFDMIYSYLERNVTANYAGDIIWSEDGNNITLMDGEFKTMYKVGENRLIQLDTEGNEIKSNIADAYIIKKIQ